MTTATLIPLHTQTVINELLLEEGEPSVSVKHTRVLLMSSVSARTHSRLSVSSWAQSYTDVSDRRTPETRWTSAIVPLL